MLNMQSFRYLDQIWCSAYTRFWLIQGSVLGSSTVPREMTDNLKYISPPVIWPPLMQWKSGLIRGMASWSRCIWNLAFIKGWPLVRGALKEDHWNYGKAKKNHWICLFCILSQTTIFFIRFWNFIRKWGVFFKFYLYVALYRITDLKMYWLYHQKTLCLS